MAAPDDMAEHSIVYYSGSLPSSVNFSLNLMKISRNEQFFMRILSCQHRQWVAE
jgi:hypothetical protein